MFSRQRHIGSAVIRGFGVLGDFSHCSVVIEDPFDGDYIIESLYTKGGVVRTSLEEAEGRSSNFEYLDLACPDPAAGAAFAESLVGLPYDLSGVFGFAFRERDWQRDDAWYCSEKCAAIAARAGIALVNNRMNGIHPSTLYHLMRASNEAWMKRQK